jgi:hypothetical protein
MLEIIDSLAGEIAELKRGAGGKKEAIVVRHAKNRKRSKLRHLKVHPEVSRSLVSGNMARRESAAMARLRKRQEKLLRELRTIDSGSRKSRRGRR